MKADVLTDGKSKNVVAGLAYIIGIAVYLVGVAGLWDLEEPSKVHTIVCLGSVTVLGILLIALAKRMHVINSQRRWTIAFLTKLLVAVLILKYSWMMPHGNVQRADSDADQLSYDLHGQILAESGLASSSIENAVRGDTKAMFWYVGFIYFVFGVSTLYVALVNSLFSLIAFLAIAGSLGRFDAKANWDAMRWGMLLPEVAFYDATPAKDPITIGTSYLMIYCVLALWSRRKYIIVLVASLISAGALLFWVRPATVFTTLLSLLVFWVFDKRIRVRTAIIGVLAGAVIAMYAAPPGSLSLTSRMAATSENLVHNESADPARRGVLDLLNASGPIDLLIKTPVRSLVFLYGPFPRILPDFERLRDIETDVSVGIQEVYQKATAIAILLITPLVFSLMLTKNGKRQSLVRFLIVMCAVAVVAGATGSLLIHLRYRTQVDPLLYASALAAKKYGVVAQSAQVWYLLVAIGSMAYYVMELLAR